MEFLRGNATASPVALFVICRYLSATKNGLSESDLASALQPLRTVESSKEESSGVLRASLVVGRGLGLLGFEKSGGGIWTTEPAVRFARESKDEDWTDFRGLLTKTVAHHAGNELDSEGQLPDLVRGIAWFLQVNPLDPPNLEWSSGPEATMKKLNFSAIENSEQWRSFQRWVLALGLARRCERPRVLIPDASSAIADQLPDLPVSAAASEWLAALRVAVPVLGAPRVLEALPQGREWDRLPPAVTLGLLKLEKLELIKLHTSDDASDVVALGLGTDKRQVGRIVVEVSSGR